jgi:hypothetical protein
VDTNVLKEHVAYIFYPEDGGSMFLQNIGNHVNNIFLPMAVHDLFGEPIILHWMNV